VAILVKAPPVPMAAAAGAAVAAVAVAVGQVNATNLRTSSVQLRAPLRTNSLMTKSLSTSTEPQRLSPLQPPRLKSRLSTTRSKQSAPLRKIQIAAIAEETEETTTVATATTGEIEIVETAATVIVVAVIANPASLAALPQRPRSTA